MNKKGFTVVELIVSFTLAMTISVFLFQIVSQECAKCASKQFFSTGQNSIQTREFAGAHHEMESSFHRQNGEIAVLDVLFFGRDLGPWQWAGIASVSAAITLLQIKRTQDA